MPPDNSEVSVRAGPFGQPMTHILSRKPTVTANNSDVEFSGRLPKVRHSLIRSDARMGRLFKAAFLSVMLTLSLDRRFERAADTIRLGQNDFAAREALNSLI